MSNPSPSFHSANQVKLADDTYAEMLCGVLSQFPILPRLLIFENIYDEATVPMIRGVWGRALRLVDERLYEQVFDGGRVQPKVPKYLMRQSTHYQPDEEQTAMEWILLGRPAKDDPIGLIHAWLEASGMGLGPERRPFILRGVLKLGPDGKPHGLRNKAWPLSHAAWPLQGDPEKTPCVLEFETPVKIIAKQMQHFEPSFVDICLRTLERVMSFVPDYRPEDRRKLKQETLLRAYEVPEVNLGWERENLVRYSARQQEELEYYGAVGAIGLPEGPGLLWPLLAAAQWIHVGKGTTLGMGMPHIYAWE